MNLHLQIQQLVIESEEDEVPMDDSSGLSDYGKQKRETIFIEGGFAGERNGNKIKLNLETVLENLQCVRDTEILPSFINKRGSSFGEAICLTCAHKLGTGWDQSSNFVSLN